MTKEKLDELEQLHVGNQEHYDRHGVSVCAVEERLLDAIPELLRSARLALKAEAFLRTTGRFLSSTPPAMKALVELMKEFGI